MKFVDDDGNEDYIDELGHHPYETYAPKYGWHIATRIMHNSIVGRALLMQRNNDASKPKYFVRTYRHRDGETYSQPDDELIQWLIGQGYEYQCSWLGERLALLSSNHRNAEFIAPYIDGGAQEVDIDHGYLNPSDQQRTKCLVITNSGEYRCCNTDGTPDENNSCACADCGRRVHEDDTRHIGYHSDRMVGDCCIDAYTYVTGRRSSEYYISDDNAVEVDGKYYDEEYLEDNGIVTLHDGKYALADNSVYVESKSDFYLLDDCVCLPDGEYEVAEDCVELHDGNWALIDDCVELANGWWVLEEDAWECAGSGKWYLKDEELAVLVNGELYHAAYAPKNTIEVTKEVSC